MREAGRRMFPSPPATLRAADILLSVYVEVRQEFPQL